jgi:hypothetical protein
VFGTGSFRQLETKVHDSVLGSSVPQSIQLQQNEMQKGNKRQLARLSSQLNVHKDSRLDSFQHIVHALRRYFWSDESLVVLQRSLAARDTVSTLNLITASQAKQKEDEVVQPACQRMCARFCSRLFVEHEWVALFSPWCCAPSAAYQYFTTNSRVLLLAFVVLGQLFAEALIYDAAHPETRGAFYPLSILYLFSIFLSRPTN